ncbi:hypothetical protein HUT16_27175 [Kitasatospora sp. NA04385]|uniref:hypothetical protein n=1 Tax=Kitasatospora sp. NA04385 TaxID=2742135 RepID=UPI0015919E7A|nr:hypothetical protein [Kitasatospora sp. NA04385]QKW22262.1 hypothetical protein HUT16_27175 [Kitasatospora sp. NA04385]
MTTPSRNQAHLTGDVAHPSQQRVRDVAALVLLVLGTVGLNAAAYATDVRLGIACTSLSALGSAAALGQTDEE